MQAYRLRRVVFSVVLYALFLLSFSSPLYAFEGAGCDLNDKTCGQIIENKNIPKFEPYNSKAAPTGTSEPGARPWRVKGSDHASITIIAYLDFLSPVSAKAMRALEETLKLYPDDVRVMFKPYPSLASPEALLAQEAAMAAGEQGAFWKMHDLLFAHTGEMTEKTLIGYAQQLKLDIKRFSSALATHRFREGILQEVTEAKGFGVNDAPTLFINGRKLVGARSASHLKGVMEEVLGLKKSDPPPSLKPIERLTFNISGAHAKGPEEAPVVIVEFSDFQCPYCARAVSTIGDLLKRYPKQVRWVFKHFPLDFHPDSPLAHAAALAAGEQGKFWEMHDLIFQRQRAMKRDHLLAYAQELKLDMEKFAGDLDSGQYQDIISVDLQEGQQAGVEGTPTFFINGRRVVGARPISDFVAIIEEELQLAQAPSSSFEKPFALASLPE